MHGPKYFATRITDDKPIVWMNFLLFLKNIENRGNKVNYARLVELCGMPAVVRKIIRAHNQSISQIYLLRNFIAQIQQSRDRTARLKLALTAAIDNAPATYIYEHYHHRNKM